MQEVTSIITPSSLSLHTLEHCPILCLPPFHDLHSLIRKYQNIFGTKPELSLLELRQVSCICRSAAIILLDILWAILLHRLEEKKFREGDDVSAYKRICIKKGTWVRSDTCSYCVRGLPPSNNRDGSRSQAWVSTKNEINWWSTTKTRHIRDKHILTKTRVHYGYERRRGSVWRCYKV